MKNLKTVLFTVLFLSILLTTSCSSSDDSNSNNSPPGLFSAYAFDARIDGATIDWTESIDIDDDLVTYAIFLEGEEIASGITTYIYNGISGLEPDTIYEGYVEARDGRGGTSIA